MGSKYIYEWFRYGDTDLKYAEHGLSMHPQPYELICYHCQQSGEKYLKGYLYYRGFDEVPKIHSLDKLCAMCSEHDISFDEITKQCATLTEYGVQPRYPDEIYIDEGLMKKALKYAKHIRDFAPLQAARSELEKALSSEMPAEEATPAVTD